jgi:predicted HicB family RNase H-like nuclease
MKTLHYIYRVEWSPEDGEYVGLCTEFPSLSWLGETYEEAFSGIRSLVSQVVAEMEGNQEALPEPLSCGSYSGNITLRTTSDLHRKLVIRAAESKVSLNRYLNSKIASLID